MGEFCADPEDEHASSTHDLVNYPPHYTMSEYEPIVVAEAIGNGYNRCTALAYLCRAPHKGNEATDVRKAAWYVRRLVTAREAFVPLASASALAIAASWDTTLDVRYRTITSLLTGRHYHSTHDGVSYAEAANELDAYARIVGS